MSKVYLTAQGLLEDSFALAKQVLDSGFKPTFIIAIWRGIAVPYYKPSRRQTDFVPDYVIHETSDWLKYPHSLEGLSPEEMQEHRPEIFEIIKDHLPTN